MAFSDIYRDKRILLTGHTGFKGAWLAEWLLALGARVTGLALPPPTRPSLFEQLGLARQLDHQIGDIRDFDLVRQIVEESRPDFVFHLAAQPLVRLSYELPVETYAVNVMGTIHLLEAIRRANRPCTVITVATDKCYENREWVHAYREEDPIGGYDPYSSSKGAAELAVAAYRRSYFSTPGCPILLASARAGNVVGGGDWALDRIVPDCIRALELGQPIPVRNKTATRPWQHVLEPLSGYLALGAALHSDRRFAGAFNFGPSLASNRPVADLVHELLRGWPGSWEDRSVPDAPHEAQLLNVATDKAFHHLGWRPVWDFSQTIRETVRWYRQSYENPDAVPELTRQQINDYASAASAAGLRWTQTYA